MQIREAFQFSVDALASNRIRTFLTALGLIIGNGSVILVVTISLTGRELILDMIRGIGSNLIYASYESGGMTARDVEADFVKMADVEAVRQQLAGRIVSATGVVTNFDRMVVLGREEDIKVIGSDDQYAVVRNLVRLEGRFLDSSDVALRQKVVLLTEKLAVRLYGSRKASIGQTIKLFGLNFTVVGVFKEKTDSFGQTELVKETALMPISVLKYFTPIERVDPMYIQAKSLEDVPAVTQLVRTIIESRHRPGAKYQVDNLKAILETASQIAVVLTIVLILVAFITLLVSGIGIMNIMLVTVTERTREIGVRMAVGAARNEILMQFLLEAVLLSLSGGVLGILGGLAVVASVRLFAPEYALPVSWTSVLVAMTVSCLVGLIFGLLPANRASKLSPTEALRYE